VLVVGALVAAPHFVDPAHFRTAIAAGLRRVTGREVVIAGPIRLSFLPVPTLSAGDVRVANPAGAAEPDLLRIATADLRLAIPPLLTGRLVLRSVILTDPVLDLERLADGRMNWRAPPPPDAGSAKPQGGDGAPELAGGEPSVSVTALRIVNGAVIYHAAGLTEQLDHLDIALNTDDLSGVVRGTGRFRTYRHLVTLDFTSMRPGERAPFHLAIGLPDDAAGAEFTGDLAVAPGGAPSVAGTLRAKGDDLAAALAALGHPMPTALARKVSLTGDLTASLDEIKLANLIIASNEIHGTGAFRIRPATVADFELSLAINRIDLDAFVAAMPTPSSALVPSAAQPPALGAFVIPPELHGALDLSLEALTWHGSLVRETHLHSTIDRGKVAISRFAALLPGGSDLSFSGALSSPGGAPRLDGALEANSDNLRQLLGWLGLPIGSVPADRLRKASLSSRFDATQERVAIDDLDLTIDATRLTGAIDVALRQRVAFGAHLAVDRLNLDAYLPADASGGAVAAQAPSPTESIRPSTQPAAAPPLNSRALLDRFDANLDATIGALTWRGQPASGIHILGTLHQGEATIEDARIADLAGASAAFSGAISGLGGDDPHWRARFTSSGPEIDHLLRLAAPGLDPTGRLSGPFSFAGDAQGERAETAIDMTLGALGGTARLSGEVAPDTAGAPAIEASLEVSHPSFARLAHTIAPGYQPAGGDPGAVTLAGKLHGSLERLTLDDAALAIGPLSIEGEATLDAAHARPKLSGMLSLSDLVLDRFLPMRQTAWRDIGPAGTPQPGIQLAQAPADAAPATRSAQSAENHWSRERFDVDWLKALDADFTVTGTSVAYAGWRIDQPALAVTLQDTALDIGRLSGGFLGGSLDGSFHLDGGGDPRAMASVTLRQVALKDALETAAGSGILDGRADLDVTLAAGGRSPAELIDGLAGNATLTSKGGTIAGVDLAAVSERLEQTKRPTDLIELFRGLSGGTTRYTALDGTFRIADGVIASDDLRFAAAASDGTARLTVDLPHWRLHSRIEFHLTKHDAAPPVAMTLDGPLDAPRKVFDINALEHYLTQRGGAAAPVTPAP
jgi:uncharacterized protein involved in outer membrane biogenesis